MEADAVRRGLTLLCATYFTVQVLRVIDGDTLEAKMEIFPEHVWTGIVRVQGVDTPEFRGPKADPDAALKAKLFVRDWVSAPGEAISIHACQRDTLGRRLVGRVCRGLCLDDALIWAGHGVRR